MDRVAVFVDAGYLFAQGSVLLCGRKLQRGELTLDAAKAVQSLAEFAQQVTGASLLRVYWYDGTSTGPSSQHLTLAYLANVKVRLGFVNSVGEQKGVDSLIITDMIALARNRGMSDAILISGDEDLRVGVQQAQEFGVRVHLVGIKPARGSQSGFLLQESDTTHEWDEQVIGQYLSCNPREREGATTPATTPIIAGDTQPEPIDLEAVAQRVVAEIPDSELEAVVQSTKDSGQIPKEIDAKLLTRGRAALKTDLLSPNKREVRNHFTRLAESRLQVLREPRGGPGEGKA